MAIDSGRWARFAVRVLVGLLFCVSAVAKLVAIDDFELYVYSYGWLSLNMSYVAARLCIGWELALALLLLTGWRRRLTRTLTLLTLVGFSLFLSYAALAGREESCECMGQLVEMTPAVSLLKNGVLICLVLIGLGRENRREERGERRFGWKVALLIAAVVVLLATPFFVSVPDSWGFGPHRERYGATELREATSEGGALKQLGVGEGRRLVAFVTPKCPYCKLARKKLAGLERRHGVPEGSIIFVEPEDIGAELWLKITYGNRPLMLLMDGQQVRATYHLRNVDEHEVAEFLVF